MSDLQDVVSLDGRDVWGSSSNEIVTVNDKVRRCIRYSGRRLRARVDGRSSQSTSKEDKSGDCSSEARECECNHFGSTGVRGEVPGLEEGILVELRLRFHCNIE